MIQVLAYYFLTPIDDPKAEVVRHQDFFRTRDITCRIYLSEEGINGQMSARKDHAEEYMDWLRSDPRFQGVSFKIHDSTEHVFPRTTVKVRRQLVAFDRKVDLRKGGEFLSPALWNEKLKEKDPDTIVVDVRNGYEWDVGHFEGAKRPPCDTFRDFPAYAQQLKEGRDLKKTRVLMYCTGGIRCEYYSAFMKEEGFSNVYQLDGGVIDYGLKEGSEHWKGKLFVFDDRLVVPVGSESQPPISHCKHCGVQNDVYYNCANMDCNTLFFSCVECLRKLSGCCSNSCLEGRVRPYREDGSCKPFRKIACSEH